MWDQLEVVNQSTKTSLRMWFGKDIYKLIFRGDWDQLESTRDKMITNKMTIDLDTFSPFMEDIIVSNMNGTLVVTIKRMWTHLSLWEAIIVKEAQMWYQQGHDILLQTGVSHMSLFFTSPRDQGRTKKKAITSGGPTINGISCPISIRKCMKNKRRLSKVEKAMKESAL